MTDPVSFLDVFRLFWLSICASLVAAALCGYLGFFVVVRRVAFVSAALGQISGLGVAIGFFLGNVFGNDPHGHARLYLDPVLMALVLTGAVAAALATVSRIQRTTPESAVAFVYLAAAACALLMLAKIVQERGELEALLFGNTVAVQPQHLEELVVVALLVVASHAFLFKDLLFVSFDLEMAKTLGLPTTPLDLVLNLSIGLTVAVATRAVGALPVFGFLVLPAGAALLMVESVRWALVLSTVGAVVAAAAGFYLSYIGNWATGPMMVVCCAAYWPLALGLRVLHRRKP